MESPCKQLRKELPGTQHLLLRKHALDHNKSLEICPNLRKYQSRRIRIGKVLSAV